MSGKVKMRCPRCSKSFRSVSAKQTLCPECEAKERQLRAANKIAPLKTTAQAPARPTAPQPKIVGPGANILIPGLAPTQPPATDPLIATSIPAPRPAPSLAPASAGAHPSHTPHEHTQRPDKPTAPHAPLTKPKAAKEPREQRPPRAPREPRPQSPQLTLTDELRAQIEQRYLELANPIEFDGIRTQIAEELRIPKATVKRAVLDLRARVQLPSWWELNAFTGTPTDLDNIRAAYLPLLPIPEVGVHKRIAATLGLSPLVVYHGIRRIRAEMRLPQYNPPDAHERGATQPTSDKPTQTDNMATSPTSVAS